MPDARVSVTMSIVAAMLLGCGDDTASVDSGVEADARPITDAHVELDAVQLDAVQLDAAVATMCTPYPVLLAPDPNAEAEAATELATISVGATLAWNDARGTLSSVSDVDADLPGCVGNEDTYEHLWTFAEAHEPLFQLDSSEWIPSAPYPCDLLAEGQTRTLTVSRATIGSHGVLRDIFVFRIRRQNGAMQLRSANGTYIPAATQALDDEMALCAALDEAAARVTVDASTFNYTTFMQCVQTGVGTYTPQPNDTLEFDPEPFWGWYEDNPNTQVILEKFRRGRLIVHPDNYTAQLLSSDAYCPVFDGPGYTMGFNVTFDSVTGEIVGVLPGIDCIVC